MFLITWLLGGTVPTRKTIKTYEYKSPPLSLFERLFLDKFWGALPGTIYPPWLAPNVITLAVNGMNSQALTAPPRRVAEANAEAGSAIFEGRLAWNEKQTIRYREFNNELWPQAVSPTTIVGPERIINSRGA